MTVEHYAGTKNLPVEPAVQENFDFYVKMMKATMLSRGFAKEAVDSLKFKLSRHTLDITAEEGRAGAFHIHAGGQPFYALEVSAPGSLMSISPTKQPYTKQSPEAQGVLLGFELGMNVMGSMNQVLQQFYGQKDDRAAGGVGGPVMQCQYETTFRCDPTVYMTAFYDVMRLRLDTVAPKPDKQPPAAAVRTQLRPK